MSGRLLLVERSASMRRVLAEHLGKLDHAVDDTASYDDAIARLDRRFGAFTEDYAFAVVGWPAGEDQDVQPLLVRLEGEDLADLPVVIMSTDLRATARAWAASRPRSALLGWKRYREIDAAIEALRERRASVVQVSSVPAPPARATLAGASRPRGSVDDIRLLVVDDSATIRRSLEDLFLQHGYAVSLARGQHEALEIARTTPCDVAIVDYYLEDDTGDAVCRALVADPAVGEIVCAVLTGTYADHIIRRSLAAGALECLFKNESSELLLGRIAALARLVRQRRVLAEERLLLDRVFDAVAGPALVLDEADAVRHVSREAIALLGHDDAAALLDRPVTEMIGAGHLPTTDGEMLRTRFRLADGGGMDMLAERRDLGEGLGSVLQFAAADSLAAADAAPLAGSPGRPPGAPSTGAPAPLDNEESVLALSQPPTRAFVELLGRVLSGDEPVGAQASVLIVGVWLPEPDAPPETPPETLRDHPDVAARLSPAVLALYRRENHVVALGDGRYAFLLRHADEPQSWLLTRKLMQMINAALEPTDGRRLATSGVLKNLAGERGKPLALLERCLEALLRVEARGLDRALLLDPRRVLGVYPERREG